MRDVYPEIYTGADLCPLLAADVPANSGNLRYYDNSSTIYSWSFTHEQTKNTCEYAWSGRLVKAFFMENNITQHGYYILGDKKIPAWPEELAFHTKYHERSTVKPAYRHEYNGPIVDLDNNTVTGLYYMDTGKRLAIFEVNNGRADGIIIMYDPLIQLLYKNNQPVRFMEFSMITREISKTGISYNGVLHGEYPVFAMGMQWWEVWRNGELNYRYKYISGVKVEYNSGAPLWLYRLFPGLFE